MEVGFILDNGYLSFDPDSVEDHDLRSWLENMAPEDLLLGRATFKLTVSIDKWGEDGPTLRTEEGE